MSSTNNGGSVTNVPTGQWDAEKGPLTEVPRTPAPLPEIDVDRLAAALRKVEREWDGSWPDRSEDDFAQAIAAAYREQADEKELEKR